MEAIISSVISLVNQYLTKAIDTGDKLFDTSVLAILTTLCALFVRWVYDLFLNVNNYNKCRYWYNYYVKKQRDPLVLNTQDFKYNYEKIEKYQSIYMEAAMGNDKFEQARKDEIKLFFEKFNFILASFA